MITIAWEWECPCLAGVRGEYYGANGAFVKLLSNTSQNHERKPENDVGTDLSKPGSETGVSTCLVRSDQGWSTPNAGWNYRLKDIADLLRAGRAFLAMNDKSIRTYRIVLPLPLSQVQLINNPPYHPNVKAATKSVSQ